MRTAEAMAGLGAINPARTVPRMAEAKRGKAVLSRSKPLPLRQVPEGELCEDGGSVLSTCRTPKRSAGRMTSGNFAPQVLHRGKK